MGELAEIGWALGIPLSLAVSAAGATLMSLNYFPQARFLVWSAPLPLVIADILWTVTTSFSIWGQVVISACVGCIVAVGTLEMLRLIEHHEKNTRRR